MFIAWLVIGQSPDDSKWLRFGHNISWLIVLLLSVINILRRGEKSENPWVDLNNATHGVRKYTIREATRNWCTFMIIILVLRCFSELMMVDVIGDPRNNIVEFMIKCILVIALVYPWRQWYVDLGSWDLEKPKPVVTVIRRSSQSASHHVDSSSSSSHSHN